MHRFLLTAIGKQKPGPPKDLADQYLKQLRLFARIETTELKEEPFRTQADAPRIQRNEANRLRLAVDEHAFLVLLSEQGKTMDSPMFAKVLDTWSEHGARPVQFIVGGPLGLDPELQEEADFVLSLSPMTFPHDLARVLLLEQLYRAMAILAGKAYHY